MSPYVYIYQTQYHVESSALLSIYALVVFVSKFYSFTLRSLVRFLIRQFELKRSYGTSGVSINCCIVNHPVKQVQQL